MLRACRLLEWLPARRAAGARRRLSPSYIPRLEILENRTALSGMGVPVALTSAFNRVGIVTDGSTFGAGLDGDGNALSANLLGSSVTWNGLTFNLGAPNTNDVVSAGGQTINLPAGSFATLNFLAVGTNGDQPSQTFTVV
jgi:hypothetical protein